MFEWVKEIYTKGTVKLKFIAYDDSKQGDEIEPYEDVATIPYEGKYQEFVIKSKLRNFIRATRDHLVVEMTVIEHIENGKVIYEADQN
jgi:hypothetical protein